MQAAAAKRLDAINARWSRDDGGISGGSEDEQGSEEEEKSGATAAPTPTAAELGIDPRLLEPDALDGPPVTRRTPSWLVNPTTSATPSYGVGLTVGLTSHDEESSEVASDETEDEIPT